MVVVVVFVVLFDVGVVGVVVGGGDGKVLVVT